MDGVIDLSGAMYGWANFHPTKGGVKLRLMLSIVRLDVEQNPLVRLMDEVGVAKRGAVNRTKFSLFSKRNTDKICRQV